MVSCTTKQQSDAVVGTERGGLVMDERLEGRVALVLGICDKGGGFEIAGVLIGGRVSVTGELTGGGTTVDIEGGEEG